MKQRTGIQAGALSDDSVRAIIDENFIATFERVGTFSATSEARSKSRHGEKNGERRVIKRGGNVVTYFCTPDLEVISFLVGPVSAEVLVKEAEWANDVFKALTRKESVKESRSKIFQSSQESRLGFRDSRYLQKNLVPLRDSDLELEDRVARVVTASNISPRRASLVLATLPLIELSDIERPVFERFAGQQGRFGRRNADNDRLLLAVEKNIAELVPTLLTSNTKSTSLLDRMGLLDRPGEISVHKATESELMILHDDLGVDPPSEPSRGGRSLPSLLLINADGTRSHRFSRSPTRTEITKMVREALAEQKKLRWTRGYTQFGEDKDSLAQRNARPPAQVAMQRVNLARHLLERNPNAARERLQKVVETFPDTEAARSARVLLTEVK